jgi:hypothetical protein
MYVNIVLKIVTIVRDIKLNYSFLTHNLNLEIFFKLHLETWF